MSRTPVETKTPIPPELAGEIEAADAIISFLLMQRMGRNPDRVIAFTRWEKKVRAELATHHERVRLILHSIGRDNPEAAAVAGAGK